MVVFSLTILVSAAYAMRTISHLFTGPVLPRMQYIADLNKRELLAAGVLVGLIVLFGLLPAALIDLSAATIGQLNSDIAARLAL
jgi:NADH-quinone oxidoreductase subunit M